MSSAAADDDILIIEDDDDDDVINLVDDSQDTVIAPTTRPQCPRCTAFLLHAGSTCGICEPASVPQCIKCTAFLTSEGAQCTVCPPNTSSTNGTFCQRCTSQITSYDAACDLCGFHESGDDVYDFDFDDKSRSKGAVGGGGGGFGRGGAAISSSGGGGGGGALSSLTMPPPTSGHCLRGHTLTRSYGIPSTYPSDAPVSCDACAVRLGIDDIIGHCAQCSFDLCIKCVTLPGTGIGPRGAHARSRALAAASVTESPSSSFPDAMRALRSIYTTGLSSTALSVRPCVALASDVDFFSQARAQGAGWSCGYRCAQMLISSLLREPAYAHRLRVAAGGGGGGGGGGVGVGGGVSGVGGGADIRQVQHHLTVPSVITLQLRLEQAWASGRDSIGAAHYRDVYMSSVVVGTDAQIGSGEVATILRAAGIDAQYLSFHAFDDPNIPLLIPHARANVAALACARATAALMKSGGRAPDLLLQPRASPPSTFSERLFLYRRQSALLKWLFTYFNVKTPFAMSSGGGGSGGGGGGGSSSSGGNSSSSSSGSGSGVRFLGNDGTSTTAPPFVCYLQHDGHSRVLVGFELSIAPGARDLTQPRLDADYFAGIKRKHGGGGDDSDESYELGKGICDVINGDIILSLLIFDPGVPRDVVAQALNGSGGGGGGEGWQSLIKRGLHTMRHCHYEIVCVPQPSQDGDEILVPLDGPPQRLYSGVL